MIDPQVAFDKLAGFQTANEIADYLREQGVKAVPESSTSCAIAVWMKHIIREKVSVAPNYIHIVKDDMELNNTSAMREFIDRFDDLEFPELITETGDLICGTDTIPWELQN